jgi:hypothetical protein
MSKAQHYILNLMMIFVMLGAALFSAFHQHGINDAVALEPACDTCVTLKQTELGALPSMSLLVLLPAFSSYQLVEQYQTASFSAISSSIQPRAPPL